MNYGFIIPKGDPRTIAELAHEAEVAGWDGAFYWDGINVREMETYDPRVVMAAMAMRTERARLGAMLTPPARRRPWKLARETATLDRFSSGRLVLPVGLGAVDDGGFSKVGEPTDRKVRAQHLDEGLEILRGLWSGDPFSYQGEHYRLDEMTFLPKPVQQPRIPIWVVGVWPSKKSMSRVWRYDGMLTTPLVDVEGSRPKTSVPSRRTSRSTATERSHSTSCGRARRRAKLPSVRRPFCTLLRGGGRRGGNAP